MSTKEKSSQLQTAGPEDFDIEYLKKITEQFSKKLIIGTGGFGIVYKGMHKGKYIAVKKLFIKPETTEKDDEHFENEVINAMLISHPNIVRLVGYCSTTNKKAMEFDGKRVFAEDHYRLICFEYLPNGSLDAYVKDKSHVHWNERYNIIKGICRGLHYLHGKHILHLDLKLANVLLDVGMVPKIADFGLSRLLLPNEEQIHTENIKGTLGYMAPERIDQRVLSDKTDIYSLGVVIMEIISGEKNPTNEQLDKAVLEARNEGMSETSLTLLEGQIKKCIQLARDCMEKEPEKRPDTKKIIEDLGIRASPTAVLKPARTVTDTNHHPEEKEPEKRRERDTKKLIEDLGTSEDTNHHPDIIEEHSVNIDSAEVYPIEEGYETLRSRRPTMMTDKESSPLLEILETSTTTERTQLSWGMRIMMKYKWAAICMVFYVMVLALLACLAYHPQQLHKFMSYSWKHSRNSSSEHSPNSSSEHSPNSSTEQSRNSSSYNCNLIRFEAASLTRFVLLNPSSALTFTYSLSVTIGIYMPKVAPEIKKLEAAAFFRSQWLYRIREKYLDARLNRTGPLSGNVTLDAAGVAEYMRGTPAGLYRVELVVVGPLVYKYPSYASCKLQTTCSFTQLLAVPHSRTEPEFQKVVKCGTQMFDN